MFTLYLPPPGIPPVSRNNNCFPKMREIETPEEFKKAVRRDHICGEFKDYKRSNANFIGSDVEVLDCDKRDF